MTHNWLLTLANERWYSSLLNLDLGETMTTEFFYDELDGFNSSAIDLAAYDHTEKQLYIRFTSGGEYIYLDVPYDIYRGLVDASSAGSFYGSAISGKFSSISDNVTLRPNPTKAPDTVPEDLVSETPDPETSPLEDFNTEESLKRGLADAAAGRVSAIPDEAPDEHVISEQSFAHVYFPVEESEVVDVQEVFKFRYGITYSYGEKGMTAYYETDQTNENLALLAFHGDVEDSQKVFPDLITNVKVKSLTRYFD